MTNRTTHRWLSWLAGPLAFVLVLAGVVFASGPTVTGSGNFVYRSGDTMTGALLLPNGTPTTPAVAFSNDTGVGLYRIAATRVGLAAGGNAGIDFNGNSQVLDFPLGSRSTIASGSNGFACTTNGCRFDFGAGANDYASSDGTTVTFAGPATVTGLVTGSGFTPTSSTVPTNGLFLPTANQPAVSVNSTETFRFPASNTVSRTVLISGGSNAQTSFAIDDHAWSATCFQAAGTNSCESDTSSVFQGTFKPSADGHVNVSLNCTWAGENTGAGIVVGAIINCGTTAGACASPTTLCSCTLDADCTTTSANMPMSCTCSGTYSANNYYKVTLTSATTCATNSPGQVVCNPTYTE